MAWLAIKLQADCDAAEALADALIEAGALSVSVEDAEAGTPDEAAQFAEPGLCAPRPWARNTLTALIEADCAPAGIVGAAANACGIAPPAYTLETIADEDWVRRTQAQFEPIRVADGFWIVPSWCMPPEPDAVNILIDPGLAFGTGSHATTRLVLRWLARTLQPGQSLLDYGCGSGILAIAAARLGASGIVGVDIDPQAVLAAADNATNNSVDVRFCSPDAVPLRPADVVVANILANPLIALAPMIAARCDGRLALSGILEAQAAQVAQAYRPDFALDVTDQEEGWVLLTGARL